MLRLLKIIATVFPVKEPSKFWGIDPDLMDRLCEEALRTRAVNSVGERSAMERKWRGANGEVGGVVCDEYCRMACRKLWFFNADRSEAIGKA